MLNKFTKIINSLTKASFIRSLSQNPQGSCQKNEKGIAIIIAIMTIALMITLVSDMIISSAVNMELAISVRDRVKSEYMAKSGLNLGTYILSVSSLMDHIKASGLLGQKEVPTDGNGSIWNIFNTLPPIGATAIELAKSMSTATENSEDGSDDPFQLKGFMNEDAAEKMQLLEDDFSIKITDELSKINVNGCSVSGSAERKCKEVIAQLKALFSCPTEKHFLSSKELKPDDLALRIKDFISEQERTESDLSSKDSPYENYKPSYKSKRLPFDSVNELKLVEGWDDDVHAVFSPYLTVYPFLEKTTNKVHELNINTVSRELLLCLIPPSEDPAEREATIQKLYKLKTEGSDIAGSKDKIKSNLVDILGTSIGEDDDSNSTEFEDWFNTRSDIFRIAVTGQTGKQVTNLTAIVRRVDSGTKNGFIEKRDIKRSNVLLFWTTN